MTFRNLSIKITSLTLVLIYSVLCSCSTDSSTHQHKSWRQYGGGPDQSKFVAETDITKENVSQLEVAWVYPVADNAQYTFSPIVVDTIMYVMGKRSSLIALNAKTGEEIWIHTNLNGLSRRGLNYWESVDKKDKRLVFTLNNSLQEIDAITGKTILTFGDSGYVDLRQGLDRDPNSIRRMQAMMPGVIYDDLVIVGSAPGEGYFSPPGHVRAYNVVTGELAWTFHTIPHPGEFGYETWPKDAYKYVGGTNVWSEMSVDAERGIVYLPIGSPTYDFYGADRIGSNLFGNSLVALNAKTGERLWHFQTVHHDLWDYDLTSAPQLITVNKDGKKIDAVAVATKSGMVYVFDRVTGDPVWPIEEIPVPPSDMPGEEAWPTQPVSTLPHFTRHEITKETLNPYYSDEEKAKWYARIDTAKSGLFIPPSDKYELIAVPGALAGANYGNSASNPEKGLVYILAQEYPSVYKLERVKTARETMTAEDVNRAEKLYSASCKTCHGENMGGGAGPSIVNAGQRISYDDFKTLLTTGRGLMPGMPHIEEQALTALYRYLGGNPFAGRFRGFGGRGNNEPPAIEGPVVASGGAKIPESEATPAMSDYPEDTEHPEHRYTTDYGTNWMDMMSPPWSYVVAYDLNNGTIKWKQPVGEELNAVNNGLKNLGAPGGALRKGMVVTSTGVVFCTAKGGKLYALDADSGDILWETNLNFEPNGQPILFSVNGKDYLVINATANFTRDTVDRSKEPDAMERGYVVYALPDKI